MNTLTPRTPVRRLLRTFSLVAGSFALTAASLSTPDTAPATTSGPEIASAELDTSRVEESRIPAPEQPLKANRTAKESLFCFVQLGFYSGTTVRDALAAPDTPLKRAMAAHFNNYNTQVTTLKKSRELAKAVSSEYDAMPLADRRTSANDCLNYL